MLISWSGTSYTVCDELEKDMLAGPASNDMEMKAVLMNYLTSCIWLMIYMSYT